MHAVFQSTFRCVHSGLKYESIFPHLAIWASRVSCTIYSFFIHLRQRLDQFTSKQFPSLLVFSYHYYIAVVPLDSLVSLLDRPQHILRWVYCNV